MSSILEQFAESVDRFMRSRLPYDQDGGHPERGLHGTRYHNLKDLVERPLFSLDDLPAYVDALLHRNTIGLDDHQLLLEKVLVLMSRLNTSIGKNMLTMLENAIIELLFNDLPHPPSGYLLLPGTYTHQPQKALPYKFRPADGSGYNPLFPSLGKAGTAYARSVPPLTPIPQTNLPDAGLLYDTLLRRDKFEPHPDGVSSLFFAFADLIIHSVFNTDHTDWNINNASSYLDLSILYGSSEAELNKVRRFDGTGRLFNDVFADIRILMMPPTTGALLVLFCRNHNYIADKLRLINESHTFKSFPVDGELCPSEDSARYLQDEEIFQRARLINCGYFMQVILGDYLGAILGLVRDGSDWRLDPLIGMRESGHKISPRGEGNVVSVEFNQLYRWHSAISEQGAEWTAELFKEVFQTEDFNSLTIDDFKKGVHRFIMPIASQECKQWTFDKLKRGPDGQFNDDDLANILHNATERSAGAFKARGVPAALRVVEVMSIKQGRAWASCTLNEFRKFLGLRPYKTFSEWNPDEKIHRAAAALYKDIDALELYVGLQAEQSKEPGPGVGLCPGYTMSRAILGDAVCLTKGDRFLTVDLTPAALTAWGYHDCQFDTQDGSYRGPLTKMLFRTLPNHYPTRSAYAHFPFLIPQGPKSIYEKIQSRDPSAVNEYIWTRPTASKPILSIDSVPEFVQDVVSDVRLGPVYSERVGGITKTFSSKWDKLSDHKLTAELRKAIYQAEGAKLCRGKAEILGVLYTKNKQWAEYLTKTVAELIREKTMTDGQGHNYVDIIGNVINLLPVYLVSLEIFGIPLKTRKNPSGDWLESTTVKEFSRIAQYVYLNYDSSQDWHLREDATTTATKIMEHIEDELGRVVPGAPRIKDILGGLTAGREFLKIVSGLKRDNGTRQLSAEAFSAVVPTVALYSQTIALVVNHYLQPDQVKAREEIVKLASSGKDNAKILPYIYEALRIDPGPSAMTSIDGSEADAKEEVFADEGTPPNTNTNGQAPTEVKGEAEISNQANGNAAYKDAINGDAGRGKKSTHIKSKSLLRSLKARAFRSAPKASTQMDLPASGATELGLISPVFLEATVPGILQAIFSLPNVQLGPGRSGQLNKFVETTNGVPRIMFQGTRGETTPWPESLIIKYD